MTYSVLLCKELKANKFILLQIFLQFSEDSREVGIRFKKHDARCRASANKYLWPMLFLDVTLLCLVDDHLRFRTAYLSHL
jgi:hypothetical protein